MAFFDDFTAALKQKWLQYYQVNHAWLALQMELEAVKTPDGGRRPPSHLILGILNALEPKLAQLMLPFARLNPSPDALIDVLELNIDPDIALGNKPASKPEPLAAPSIVTPPAAPIEDAFEEEEESLAEPVMVVRTTTVVMSEEAIDDFDDEPSIVLIESETQSFGDIGLDEFGDTSDEVSVEEDEGFGDIALDEFGDTSSESEALSEEDDGFGDIALDEFGETASESAALSEEDDGFGDIALDEFGETASEQPSAESDADFGTELEAWGDETPEELEIDLGDMTLDEFGDTSSKGLEDDDLDAFGDISFDPFSEPAAKSDDDDDAWSK
ncbi:DUF5331 domain-containing protein [Argonema galeatum]|uniref:DUF5331 domain-containing protein n=1 Tax=Argonema galeatum TaxID=2942762 RepID=UPI0020124CE2|nr:DUF5331 domain-containing protein [Argonema galeatum A003/A1]